MSFFNFVETFFFISLAITFVLIMMLVYHFKDRLSALEKKTNTIVDIINNVVKELTIIKQQVITYNQIVPLVDVQSTPLIQSPMQRIEVIENDSALDSESESESEISESNDSDDDSTVDDNEDDEHEQSESENIKRININLSQDNTNDEDLGEEMLEIQREDLDVIEDIQEEFQLNENEPPIIINKIDESLLVNEEESNLEELHSVNQPDSEIYRKMEVGTLRALVISKGLASDTKKMKKHDLIRLLENAQE